MKTLVFALAAVAILAAFLWPRDTVTSKVKPTWPSSSSSSSSSATSATSATSSSASDDEPAYLRDRSASDSLVQRLVRSLGGFDPDPTEDAEDVQEKASELFRSAVPDPHANWLWKRVQRNMGAKLKDSESPRGESRIRRAVPGLAYTWDGFLDGETLGELLSAVDTLFDASRSGGMARHIISSTERAGLPEPPSVSNATGFMPLSEHGSPAQICFPSPRERSEAVAFSLSRIESSDPKIGAKVKAWLAERDAAIEAAEIEIDKAQEEDVRSMSPERYRELMRASLAMDLTRYDPEGAYGASCVDAGLAAALDMRRALAISTSLLIPDGREPLLDAMWAAVERELGLPSAHGYHTQALRYVDGELYDTHTDCDEASYRADPSKPAPYGPASAKNDRAVTVLVYLSATEEGGETYFPDPLGKGEGKGQGVSVSPEPGRLLTFRSLLDDGTCDPNSRHRANPPRGRGRKVVLQRWYHQQPMVPGIEEDSVACDAHLSCRSYANVPGVMEAVVRLSGADPNDTVGMGGRSLDKPAELGGQEDGGPPALVDAARRAADTVPEMAYFHFEYANRALAAGDASTARSALRTVMLRYPWHSASHRLIAEAYDAERTVAEASASSSSSQSTSASSTGAKASGGGSSQSQSQSQSQSSSGHLARISHRVLVHAAADAAVQPNNPDSLITLGRELYAAAAVYGNGETEVPNVGTERETLTAAAVVIEEAMALLDDSPSDEPAKRKEAVSFLAGIYHRLGHNRLALAHLDTIADLERQQEERAKKMARNGAL